LLLRKSLTLSSLHFCVPTSPILSDSIFIWYHYFFCISNSLYIFCIQILAFVSLWSWWQEIDSASRCTVSIQYTFSGKLPLILFP
jgi:hypothetical protein